MQQVRLSGKVTSSDAEIAVARLAVPPEALEPLELDLTNATELDIGAGPRIGNALRRYSKLTIRVLVPSAPDGKWESYFSQYWKRALGRSGLGLAIATHATTICTITDDVTKDFRDHFLHADRETFKNVVEVRDIHKRSNINADDRDAFTTIFFGYLSNISVPLDAFTRAQLDPLIELCREAILNVQDHAFRKPLHAETEIVSYFSFRFYQHVLEIDGGGGPFDLFLTRLEEFNKQAHSPKLLGYLEVVVNDDGVGIAARQCQTENVYWGPKGMEEKALLDALRTSGSVKPIAMDAIARGDPGYGFSIMADSLKRLRGFASLRTGRYLAVCDGTRAGPFSDSFKIASDRASSRLGCLPGALIQAVIPIRPAQSSLQKP